MVVTTHPGLGARDRQAELPDGPRASGGTQEHEAEVDTYVADPDCGFIMSTGGLADMVRGLADINTDRSASRVPKDLPIHLASGDRCQVGEDGKGPREVADRFRKVGVQDVTLTLWPEARHEILHETNRDEVEAEIVEWLDAHLPAKA